MPAKKSFGQVVTRTMQPKNTHTHTDSTYTHMRPYCMLEAGRQGVRRAGGKAGRNQKALCSLRQLHKRAAQDEKEQGWEKGRGRVETG